jgi:hypothetical protein
VEPATANTWLSAKFYGSIVNIPPPGSSAITGTQKETVYNSIFINQYKLLEKTHGKIKELTLVSDINSILQH